MASLFSSPKMPAVQPAPAAPTVTDPSVQQAQQEQAREAAEADGRQSTILTSGLGVSTAPVVQRKMLLGS